MWWDLVEAWAGHRGRGTGGRALEPDRTALIRGLLDLEEVRLAGGDQFGQGDVVVQVAYGFVVEAGGGVRERGGHGRAGKGSVDEEGALMGALDAALILFVVEDELVAQLACGLGEVVGGLVGVGAVGCQQPGRETERNERGEGVDGVRADSFAWRVQDEAESELRVPADAQARLRMMCGVATAGGDEQGGAVSEDAFLGAAAVVPAAGVFDGGQVTAFAGRMVPGGDGGGVGADVPPPPFEQAATVCETDGDQQQTVTDLLQQAPTADAFGVRVFPGRDHVGCFVSGQAAAPVTAVGIKDCGQPVEGPVDTAGERDPGVVIVLCDAGDAQPSPRGLMQFVEQDPAGIREAGTVVVVQRQQQPHQHRPHRKPVRPRPSGQFRVDQFQHAGRVQQRVELAYFRVRDLRRGVGNRPRPTLLDPLRVPPGPGLGHRSGPRSNRAAVASSRGGTRCW